MKTIPLISPKLQPWHLERRAVVYVWQFSPRQVQENVESMARQYALVIINDHHTVARPAEPQFGFQWARNSQYLGEPLCQGVVGRELDRFVTEQVMKVLEPASLELCLSATDDLEQERQRLERHWRQRLERAAHQADRVARQFHASNQRTGSSPARWKRTGKPRCVSGSKSPMSTNSSGRRSRAP